MLWWPGHYPNKNVFSDRWNQLYDKSASVSTWMATRTSPVWCWRNILLSACTTLQTQQTNSARKVADCSAICIILVAGSAKAYHTCLFCLSSVVSLTYYPIPIGGRGIVFDRFLCLYLCFLLVRLQENGWTNLHETFREGAEWPWDDLIQFWVNSEKPHDAVMRNTGMGFVVL